MRAHALKEQETIVAELVPAEPSSDGRDEPSSRWSSESASDFVGRFVVLEELGKGGMGTVFKAYDPRLRREVALKLLHARRWERGGSARLVHEAQAMARLSHPNVVAIYDVIAQNNRVALALEYVPGQTLRDWLATSRSWQDVVRMFVGAGRGLAAAHGAGIIHRDFKPANVLISSEEGAKVTDFGISDAATPETSDGGARELVGTPKYMAPEQHLALPLDARADQYSFCLALWEALCGSPPFEGHSAELVAAKLAGPPSWPRHVVVPRSLVHAILRGLAPDPQQRFESLSDVLRVLESVTRPRRRAIAWAFVSPVVIVMAGGLAMWQAERATRCTGAAEKLTGVWDEGRRDAVGTAILATDLPYAPQTWAKLQTTFDDYATAWAEQHRVACEATAVAKEQPEAVLDLRMACLHRASVGLRSAVDVLARADAGVVENAARLAAALPSLSRCADVDALQTEVPPADDPDEASVVEQIRTILAEANALEHAGKYDAAAEVVTRAEAQARDVTYEPVHAEISYQRGFIEERLGQFALAKDSFEQAMQLGLSSGMIDLSARATAKLAFVIGSDLRRPFEVLDVAELGLAMAMQSSSSPETEAHARHSLGTLLLVSGQRSRAIEELRAAITLRERALGLEHPLIADGRYNIAYALLLEARYDEAAEEYAEVLRLRTEILGTRHPRVAEALHGMALIAHERGRNAEARSYFERTLALLEEYGAPIIRVLNARTLINVVLTAEGRYAEAEAGFRVLLPLYEQHYGRFHSSTGDTSTNLALTLLLQGRYEAAEAYQRRAREVAEVTQNSQALAITYNNQGLLELGRGRYDAAETAFSEAIAIFEGAVGSEHALTAEARMNRARCWIVMNRLAEAKDAIEAAQPVLIRMRGANHELVARASHALGEISLRLGEPTRARVHFEQAWAIRSAQGGAPEERAQTAFALASSLWDNGDYDRALELAAIASEAYAKSEAPVSRERDAVATWIAQRPVRRSHG